MGFIGGYVTPIIGINEEDKKDVYYVIDEIRFNSDISTNNTVNINITFNIYPSINNRESRINLIGGQEYTKTISRSEFTGNILEDYYTYCKPLIIENLKNILIQKLGLDISDDIPSEYSEYYTLTDHL
tara:strand:+ start:925 stop:1308 length:384 start_codon:yes stop_codon:yes gene_type:complete